MFVDLAGQDNHVNFSVFLLISLIQESLQDVLFLDWRSPLVGFYGIMRRAFLAGV